MGRRKRGSTVTDRASAAWLEGSWWKSGHAGGDRDRYRAIFDAAPIGLLQATVSGRLLRVNERCGALLGYAPGELIGRRIRNVVHPDDAATVASVLDDIRTGVRPDGRAVLRYVTKSGSIVPGAAVFTAARRPDGTVEDVIGLLEPGPAPAAPAPGESDRGERLAAVGRVAGRVGHDINDMLMVVRRASESAALDPPRGRRAKDALTAIRDASNRAAAYLAPLVALTPGTPRHEGVVDLNSLMADVEHIVPENITLRMECVSGPLLVEGSATTLVGVVDAVVANACEAMPDGGRLTIVTGIADLDGAVADAPRTAQGTFGVLAVTDTGPGMSDEVQARLFEPFASTKPTASHPGLGLATSYATVRRAGGFLEVDSRGGVGTSVRIYLPRAEESVDAEA